jgi:A/G-specific adenine glycosylase
MKQEVQAALLSWYEKAGRHDLPWRNTDDVYHVYVSEIMLQQTQVKRVMEEYYPNFLEKFPTLRHLADAKEEDVLAAWSGLGYYSRARNLHKTAKLCTDALPKNQKELLKLPGIGRYTASAVCSFALNQETAVVDTNIARVIRRFFALYDAKDEDVWQYAQSFVNTKEPRAHNLALMDLGSLVCLPVSAKCKECPLRFTCKGKEEPELYTKKKKTEYEAMELFYGIVIQNGKIALKLSKGPMYKGMLELPSVDPLEEDFIAEFKHSYTKYRLTVKLYTSEGIPEDVEWYRIEDLENAHISSLTKKALKAIL